MTQDLSSFSVASGDDVVQQKTPTVSGQSLVSNRTAVSQTTSDSSTQPKQPVGSQQVGSTAKEQMEMAPTINPHEKVPIVETRENETVPEEVSSWMEKLEQGEDIQLPQPVTHDDQVLVSNVSDDVDETMIVLPMTEAEVQQGLHEKIYSGARWLAEWCVKLAKKFHGHVVYRMSKVEVHDGSN